MTHELAVSVIQTLVQMKSFENARRILTRSEKGKINEVLDCLELEEIKAQFGYSLN